MRYLKVNNDDVDNFSKKGIVVCSVPFNNDEGYINAIDYSYSEEFKDLEIVKIEEMKGGEKI